MSDELKSEINCGFWVTICFITLCVALTKGCAQCERTMQIKSSYEHNQTNQ